MKLRSVYFQSARAACLSLFVVAALLNPWSSQSQTAKDSESVLHYLAHGRPDSALILAPPPLAGSAEQAADMAEVLTVHRACSSNDAEIAFSEKKFSVFNFTSAIGDFFQPAKFPKTEAFFQRVQKDAAVVTDEAKEHWKRPRPYTLDPSLAAGKLEKSYAYPSGHSTEATVLALVLADLFPERRDEIMTVSRDIGWHRVWIARHYPTDIYAGRVFALAIVRELKTSAKFQQDFAEAGRELAQARERQPAAAGVVGH